MSPKISNAMRRGGLSRRGFLRALGITACAALVPGLAFAQVELPKGYITRAFLMNGMPHGIITETGAYAMVTHARNEKHNGLWRIVESFHTRNGVCYRTIPEPALIGWAP